MKEFGQRPGDGSRSPPWASKSPRDFVSGDPSCMWTSGQWCRIIAGKTRKSAKFDTLTPTLTAAAGRVTSKSAQRRFDG